MSQECRRATQTMPSGRTKLSPIFSQTRADSSEDSGVWKLQGCSQLANPSSEETAFDALCKTFSEWTKPWTMLKSKRQPSPGPVYYVLRQKKARIVSGRRPTHSERAAPEDGSLKQGKWRSRRSPLRGNSASSDPWRPSRLLAARLGERALQNTKAYEWVLAREELGRSHHARMEAFRLALPDSTRPARPGPRTSAIPSSSSVQASRPAPGGQRVRSNHKADRNFTQTHSMQGRALPRGRLSLQ